jgi:hypothetical protein
MVLSIATWARLRHLLPKRSIVTLERKSGVLLTDLDRLGMTITGVIGKLGDAVFIYPTVDPVSQGNGTSERKGDQTNKPEEHYSLL